MKSGRALVMFPAQRGHGKLRAQSAALCDMVDLGGRIIDAESEVAHHTTQALNAAHVMLGRGH